MKIVILDGHTANPGDLSWDALKELGELEVYERTKPEDLLSRAKGAEVLLTNKVVIDAKAMASLPSLRYIGVLATGYNVVDIDEAHRRGIVVTNIPAYSTMSVAQMVMAHLLNITSQVALHAEAVRQGEWERSPDFCLTPTLSKREGAMSGQFTPPLEGLGEASIIELDGMTMGIVGLGNIGRQVARMAQAMGMKVMAVSSKPEEELRSLCIRKATGYEQLFSEADVVSLHCPLTDETRHLVNRERLALMKPTAILINTGRGPLLDEQAVADALAAGKLYAVGVDVLTEEPPHASCPLLHAPNCYITPHIAWASAAARRRLIDIATGNVSAFLQGKEENIIK
ncbi:MAG: D-2-hydroxyacid dehydrogenase [Bacteroidaceae bacterium]|nr:D-2-hydroxyacid dehydrogenase [Bacteroidaceae bacterium]